MALLLGVYKIARAVVTLRVAGLREEQEFSGHTPRLTRYGWLLRLHTAVGVLRWLAVLAFAYHGLHWLLASVWLPA